MFPVKLYVQIVFNFLSSNFQPGTQLQLPGVEGYESSSCHLKKTNKNKLKRLNLDKKICILSL